MNTREWEQVVNWGTLRSGQVIKVTHGEEVIIGEFVTIEAGWIKVKRSGSWANGLPERGATIFVESAPPFPSEAGLYSVDNGMVVERTHWGEWMSPNGSSGVAEYVRQSRSFTRLEPVPETAKKVLAAVERAFSKYTVNQFGPNVVEGKWEDLDAIAEEFGVADV